jgi:hypothetical protein
MAELVMTGTFQEFINSIDAENYTDDDFYDSIFTKKTNEEIYFIDKFDKEELYKKGQSCLYKDRSTNKKSKVFNCIKDLTTAGVAPTEDTEHWEVDRYEEGSNKIYISEIGAFIKQFYPFYCPKQLEDMWLINKEFVKKFIFLIIAIEITNSNMPISFGITTSESITSLSQSIEIPEGIRNNEYLMNKCKNPYFGGDLLNMIMELPFDNLQIYCNRAFEDIC